MGALQRYSTALQRCARWRVMSAQEALPDERYSAKHAADGERWRGADDRDGMGWGRGYEM